MYKRDVAIVFVACFALFFSLQHEGRVSIRKAWYHGVSNNEADLFNTASRLPPPVVGDLNGDGSIEVITVTHDFKIEVVKPRLAGKHGEGFAKSHVIASVSLLQGKVAVPGSRKPAALSVGYIDAAPAELVAAPRKQVVVVVTAGWHVMCFDHNLKLLWEHTALEALPHHAKLEEVAIHISPHQVHKGDRGIVVVGGALLLGDLADPDIEKQIVEEEVAEDMDPHPAPGAPAPGTRRLQADPSTPDFLQHDPFFNPHISTTDGVDTSRHFSYYAYDGGSGVERWKHEASSFHPTELEELVDETHPQNNFKLEAEKLQSRHFSEASCRDYRESVAHVMPHSWSSWQDTQLEAAHFVKHKQGRGAQKHKLSKQGGKGAHSKSPPARLGGFMSTHPLSALLGGGGHKAHPHAGGTHGHHGHGKGRNLTKVNTLVAHLRDGIEAVQLYNGRVLCQLHLATSQLHVDIDGDGVMDHVAVESGVSTVALGGGMGMGTVHHQSTHCTVVVKSGIPPRPLLWTAPVCNMEQGGGFMDHFMEGGEGERTYTQGEKVELPTPAFLPLPHSSGGYGKKGRQQGLLVFSTNKGEVTALNAVGEVMWTDFHDTSWLSLPGGKGDVPTLRAIPLRPHAIPTAVLVGGATAAVLLSEHGKMVAHISLPFPPTHPLVVADFNGDGLNDFMLVTRQGVFGYQQMHHPGGFPFSVLVLTLVMAMALVYFTQQYDTASGRARKIRSTDYTD